MKLLVVGGRGFLGREIVRQSVAAGDSVAATYRSRPPDDPAVAWHAVDIRDADRVAELLSVVRPDAVINAAYRKDDWASTGEGAAKVALATAAVGGRFLQVSSDAVFSGAAIHYDEDAVPDPISPYGAAKAAAETAITVISPDAVIARTSLIIGDGGSPHERLVRDLATGERDGMLFTDEIRCPVHVADLAAALRELARSDRAGMHHLAGADAISRHELGQLIARRDGLDADRLRTGMRAATEVPGPIDVRLDCTRTQRWLRTRLRGARSFLAR